MSLQENEIAIIEERGIRGSIDLVENATLETIIPDATEGDIESLLLAVSNQEQEYTSSSPLSGIKQRQNLFFDETVDVYVVLQTATFDEATLRSYLARLVIVLEVQIINAASQQQEGSQHRETVYSASVLEVHKEDPIIVLNKLSDEDDDTGQTILIWKLSVLLDRPQRLRPQAPSVSFSTSASLKSAEQLDCNVVDDEYMPSAVPAGINLLESFANDANLGDGAPKLSALRVSRVAPSEAAPRDLGRAFTHTSKQTWRISSAFSARVRYSRSSSTPSKPSMIASLDVDIASYAFHELDLEYVCFEATDALVEDLNLLGDTPFPIKCLPRDEITFLYHLSPAISSSSSTSTTPVHVKVSARVHISDACKPRVLLDWTSSIDLTKSPINASFTGANQAITVASTRDRRPASLSFPSSTLKNTPSASQSSISSIALQDPLHSTLRSNLIPDFGLTMTFTAMYDEIPRVGEEFSWDVFVVNRSDRSRKLALIPVPTRTRRASAVLSSNRPPSRKGSVGCDHDDIGVAVVDDNIVLAMQRNAAADIAGVVCLSPDIRIGPLAPQACQNVELRFLALAAGVRDLWCVRVVDLSTQEHVDVRDLPSIVVAGKL